MGDKNDWLMETKKSLILTIQYMNIFRLYL